MPHGALSCSAVLSPGCGMAQKIHRVCPHVYHCSSEELAPYHAQTQSKFKPTASCLGNKDLDSLLLLSNSEYFPKDSPRRWSMCLSSVGHNVIL